MSIAAETVALSRADAEQFLFAEAALLDAADLTAWLALFTQDATYWLPSGPDVDDPDASTSLVYDDHDRLADRVWRLTEGPAHAQIPPSRTQRVVGNVRDPEAEGDEHVVRSAFSLFEYRKGELRPFAGQCLHRLRGGPSGLQIAHKRVDLVNAGGPMYNLTFVV